MRGLFEYLQKSNRPTIGALVWLAAFYAINAPNTVLPGGRVWDEALLHVRIVAFSPFLVLLAIRLFGAVQGHRQTRKSTRRPVRPAHYWPVAMLVFAFLLSKGFSTATEFFFMSTSFAATGYLFGQGVEWLHRFKTRSRSSDPHLLKKVSIAFVPILAALGAASYDSYRNTPNSLTLLAPVRMFKSAQMSFSERLGMLQPAENLKISRIRYVKDGMAIQVVLQDGQTPWIFPKDNVVLRYPK